MKIAVYKIDAIAIQIEVYNVFEMPSDYFKSEMEFDILEQEGQYIINVEVTDKAYFPEKGEKMWCSTITGFVIEGDDMAFLKNATNPKTLELCVNLAEIAMAHNRMYFQQEGLKHDLEILVPYTQNDRLLLIVRDSLLSSLN